MVQIKEGARIENPREYESSAVEHLRRLLEIGIPTDRDPQREHFYEVETHSETYYIHISPITGDVMLLARWLRQPHDRCLSTGHPFA